MRCRLWCSVCCGGCGVVCVWRGAVRCGAMGVMECVLCDGAGYGGRGSLGAMCGGVGYAEVTGLVYLVCGGVGRGAVECPGVGGRPWSATIGRGPVEWAWVSCCHEVGWGGVHC